MTQKEDVDDMTIWQNHEQRITALEVTMNGLAQKMDSVESTIKDGNKEQKDMLDSINNRMVEEFFHKKRTNLSNGWSLLIAVFGGGGFIYLLIDKIF